MAARTLSQLGTQVMQLASNTRPSDFVNDWIQWSIEEIWNESLWDFRVREAATPITTSINDNSGILAGDFDKPREFRITAPSASVGSMQSIEELYLKRYVPDITDTDKAGTPRFWIRPILYDGTSVYTVRFWPPADAIYTIDYSYYISHPKLASNAPHLIPERWEKVIISRAMIYVKEHEDEISLGPYERRFQNQLARMKSSEKRHPGVLLGWRHERELQAVHRAIIGNDPSLDIGR